MRGRLGALAWSLAALAVAFFLGGVILSALGSATLGPRITIGDAVVFAAFLTYPLVGAVVAAKYPGNPIGWLLILEGLLFQVICLSIGWVRFGVYSQPGSLPAGRYVAWAGNSTWVPILVTAMLVFLLFPTGHLRSRKWRAVVGLGLVVAVAAFAGEAFRPGSMGGSLSSLDNPFGIPGAEHLLSTLGDAATVIVGPVFVGAALLSFLLRFRDALGLERQQMRWLAFAALLVAVGFGTGDILQAVGVPASLTSLFYVLALAALPASIGVAILAHRLYDIEVVIDRTVIVAGMVAFAGLVYLALVIGVGAIVGDRTGSNVVLASLATAVVALGFQPVLGWVRRLSRRIAYGRPTKHETGAGLALRCLGAFRVMRDGRPVSATAWQSKKARTLVKILIARRGRSTPRDLLMEIMWPDEEPAKLANRLSVALATARSVLDPDKSRPPEWFLVADRDAVRIDARHVAIDVEDFLGQAEHGLTLARTGQAAAAAPMLNSALALYVGDFLEEDAYENWAEDLREEARQTYLAAARSLAQLSVTQGRHDAAVGLYLRVLARDAWDEDAHLGMVRALEEAGRHGEAHRRYRTYVARMGELDIPAAPFPA